MNIYLVLRDILDHLCVKRRVCGLQMMCCVYYGKDKLLCLNQNNRGSFAMLLSTVLFVKKKLWILLEIYQYFWDNYMQFIRQIMSKKKGFGMRYIGDVERTYWYNIADIIVQYVIDDWREDYKEYKENDDWIGGSVMGMLSDGFDLNTLWNRCPTCGGESVEINKAIKMRQDHQEWIQMQTTFNEELVELAQDYTLHKNKYLSSKIDKKWKNKHRKKKTKNHKYRKRYDVILFT
eukprot:105483_1